MNIHPIFVHFPIALLTLYALFEFVPMRLAAKIRGFNSIKLAFLFIGTLGSVVAGGTGLIAARGVTGTVAHLIEVHKIFSIITIIYFLIISCIYLASLVREKPIRIESQWSRIIHSRMIGIKIYIFLKCRVLFALIGLALVTITGGLGGIIVYGPSIDPLANFIYQVFFGG